MSTPVNLRETDYKKPVRVNPIKQYDFLRTGGLYKNTDARKAFFFMVISIREAIFLQWSNSPEPKEVKEIWFEYLIGEKLWTWKGSPEELSEIKSHCEQLR